MNKTELIEKLTQIVGSGEGIGAALYFLMEENGEQVLKFADIDEEVNDEILERVSSYIHSKFLSNEDLSVLNLSDADNRMNTAYYYDVGDMPEKLRPLSDILDSAERPKFNFREDDMSKITGVIMTVGNERASFSLYQHRYSINLLKRGSVLRIIPADTRFTRLNANVLNVSDTFDFLWIDNRLIVMSVKTLEKHFGFQEVIMSKAAQNLASIGFTGLIEDMTLLNELASDIKTARKLMKIKENSPVLNISHATIIQFVKLHPVLKKKLQINESTNQLQVNTKVSRDLLIKMLNDDFLKSELTHLYYESQAKDTITDE